MPHKLPTMIKKVGFDFHWSNRKVWKVKAPVVEMSIKKLEWMFDIPFWWTKGSYYNLSPNQVIANPKKYSYEYKRTMKADLKYPIDIMFYKGRWLILDGLHRLVKAKLLGMKVVKVRKIPKSKVRDILKQPKPHH